MELCSSDKCSSCMSCINACPYNAIVVKTNQYAAIQPEIEQNLCKGCGICQIVCSQKNNPKLNYPVKAFALYSKSIYDQSTCSSGGAATVFSRYIISQGGCVFGATSVGGYPHYIKASSEEELELLKGSKYVFCDPQLIYKEVKLQLSTGRMCLFIGPPCYVAGLYGFLRRVYDNLVTVDFICHGTPPFSFLKEHLETKVGCYSRVGNFTFRGVNDFFLTVYDKDNNVIYRRNQFEDEYFMSFMKGFILRPICYECQFAQNKRVSDITIGDFWNIADDALGFYKGKISVALLSTSNGIDFFDCCKHLFCYEERNVSEAINGNNQLMFPSKKTVERSLFLKLWESNNSVVDSFRKMGITTSSRINKIKSCILYIPRKLKRAIKK